MSAHVFDLGGAKLMLSEGARQADGDAIRMSISNLAGREVFWSIIPLSQALSIANAIEELVEEAREKEGVE